MQTRTEDKWQNAREQAQAQFESIREMVEALRAPGAAEDAEVDETALEDAQIAIQEDALSVEVRSEWHAPGQQFVTGRPGVGVSPPAEYRILLCTGGPAVQIMGKLSGHGGPETACLQMQDWFLPWTEYRPTYDALYPAEGGDVIVETQCVGNAEEILLAYARQFYFGE